MGRRDEELLGRIAVREGFLDPGQIEECVGIQRKETVYRPLGALLIEKGYLEPRQLHRILQKQGASAPAKGERERLEQELFCSNETKWPAAARGKVPPSFGNTTPARLQPALR